MSVPLSHWFAACEDTGLEEPSWSNNSFPAIWERGKTDGVNWVLAVHLFCDEAHAMLHPDPGAFDNPQDVPNTIPVGTYKTPAALRKALCKLAKPKPGDDS
jgi:hypothetical protein